MIVDIKEVGTKELWEQFQRKPLDIYASTAQRMKDAGIEQAPTLSRVLEEVSPSEKGDNLDAFERLMQEAGIRASSDPVAGYWSSDASMFSENAGTRALLTEYFARNWRKVSFGLAQQRAIFLSSDGIAGSWERPFAEASAPRQSRQVAPAIPLSELVAMTTPIDGDTYRSYYLTYDEAKLRQFRVGESAEIPIADLVGSQHTIGLKKYGRGLRASYEVLRRMSVEKLGRYIQWMAVQSEIDKVAAALAVLVAGDGNANTAATEFDLTVLDTDAVAGELTLKGWVSFDLEFAQPYILTTALMQKATAIQMALLNTGSANNNISQMNGVSPRFELINNFSNVVRYGVLSDAPTGKIVAFDNRFALERVTEIGSEISEMERYITNQTQVIVMSEIEGYGILDANATKVLDVAS